MRRWLAVASLGLAFGCGDSDRDLPEGGTFFYITFDERHGLQGRELVRLLDFDIGVVTAIDLAGGRVRATVELSPDALSNLTEATTFSVETGDDGLFVETHVLDAEASKISEGSTLQGVDSSLELAARRAAAAASDLLGRAAGSEWWDKGAQLADQMRKELDAVDWGREEQALKEQWAQTVDELDRAADESLDEVRASVESLIEELERAGHSEEAKRLAERFNEMLSGSGER